jgi:hypothetical protein
MDAITIMNHFRLEFPFEDLLMIKPIIGRPRPTAPPRATPPIDLVRYGRSLGRVGADSQDRPGG